MGAAAMRAARLSTRQCLPPRAACGPPPHVPSLLRLLSPLLPPLPTPARNPRPHPYTCCRHRERNGGCMVLSVDDDPINQLVVENLLLPEGFKVEQAMCGSEALDWLQHTPLLPDVILLDIMMPDMSGYEVGRRGGWMPGAGCGELCVRSYRVQGGNMRRPRKRPYVRVYCGWMGVCTGRNGCLGGWLFDPGTHHAPASASADVRLCLCLSRRRLPTHTQIHRCARRCGGASAPCAYPFSWCRPTALRST